MTVEQFDALLGELRAIRDAVERSHVPPVFVDYATAARMLCCSKRSVERLVAEQRVRTYNIAGPKLRVDDLRRLGDDRTRVPRRASRVDARDTKEARAELRELVRRHKRIPAAGR